MEFRYTRIILIICTIVTVSAFVRAQTGSSNNSAAEISTVGLTASEIADWREDLRYIADEFPAKHANLFHRLDRAEFEKAIHDLDAGIPDLTRHQVILEMARIVGMARDGHSYLSAIWDPKNKFQFFPIRFYVFSDGVYVTEAADEYKHLLGARLVEVERLSIDKAIERIGPYMSSDNYFGIHEYAPFYLASPTVLNALGISSSADTAEYSFERNGKAIKLTAKLVPGKDHSITAMRNAKGWQNVRDNAANPKPLTYKYPDKRLWFEYVADKKLLFVQMNNVLDAENQTIEQFFGEVVSFAKTNDVEKFVLDLRHNGGGNNTLVRPIIRGLIQLEDIDKRGNLFVITGRRTFSAAQNLVNQLETWTNAVFVGEPTGSHVNMYGDARSFYLPKSGLTFRISELFWQNKHARDERKWTPPHVAAEPNFEDYRNNIDPAMKAVYSYSSKLTLQEMAMKRYATLDVAGFREDVIAFEKDPANKYVEIESQINRYGYDMINQKQWDAAIALFQINVELYPGSWNAYDSLAEAFMHKGDNEQATKFYKKSLELNPDNSNAVTMLDRIKNGGAAKSDH